ncbi:MAG: fimbrillin family protein [Tannerella sp.]|jgi:hypothetical protein|nr:fimbrillin family protein [Tannerella sp.]
MSVKRLFESWRIAKMCSLLLLTGALTLLITSCETEYIPETPEVGITTFGAKEGNFIISVKFAEYGEGDMNPETLSKEIDADSALAIARHLEPETDIIRLDDDLIIYATLSVDKKDNVHPVNTRAFAPNSKIFIVAYDSTATNVFTKVFEKLYKVNALNTLVRDDGSTDLINLPAGYYKLIAYSYNDSTTVMPLIMPASITNVDPMYDLIWGSSPTTTVVEGTITPIAITMYHKLSQVTLVAKTRDGTNISDFSSVTMPGYTVDMTTMTGALAKNTATPMTFNFPAAAFPNDSVKSDTRIVYTGTPGDIPTVIRIGSMTVNGKVLPDFSSTFAKSLQSGYSYTMRMQIGNSPDITDDPPPGGFFPYVGAFWKHDQQGERLIRMARASSGAADGVWSAQVIEGRDWIMLDKLKTTDGGIYTPAAMLGNNGSFEGAHQLPAGASTFVSGYMINQPDSNEIYFRIGLRGTVPADSVRYGLVLLTYSHNNLRQRIWVRQGDAPDYVFSNSDQVPTGAPITERTVTRQFSPYNLTAATLNAPVSVNGAPYNPPTQNDRPAIFTEYPTQAGAFFQWATLGPNIRYAWDPITQVKPGWDLTQLPSNVFWSDLASSHETCPPGFRRPTDGLTNAPDVGPDVSRSEMRQSLYENPPQSTSVRLNGVNAVFGYYADGFFDRMQITNGPGTSSPGVLSSVAATDANRIAHRGWLYYNRNTLASLFFPGAGIVDDGLSFAGTANYYLSSTAQSSTPVYNIYTAGTNSNQSVIHANNGASIRCVKRPDGTLLCFNNSTQGKEFWVSYGENYASSSLSNRLELRVASDVNTTVTLQFTDTLATVSYPVVGGQVTRIDLGAVQFPGGIIKDMRKFVYLEFPTNSTPPTGSSTKTLKITSLNPVSVYAFNTQSATTDATALLPVTAWGQDYYRISYKPYTSPSSPSIPVEYDFEIIIANQNGTNLYVAGNSTPFETLNAGQAYYNTSGVDMTGRHITADKPVAYFTHSTITNVPTDRFYADILYEQLAPVNQWGYRFLVPNAPQGDNPMNNHIRILSSQDNTKITYTGAVSYASAGVNLSSGGTLNAGQWTELEITGSDPTNAACYIESDNPIGVVSYMVGGSDVSNSGDPSICWIPAVDRQMVQSEIIAPFMFEPTSGTNLGNYNANMHYMIIITPTATAMQTTVNGAPISSGWVNDPSGFSHYIWYFISPSSPTSLGDLNNDFKIVNNNGLIILAGGIGNVESYYYNAGSGTCDVVDN